VLPAFRSLSEVKRVAIASQSGPPSVPEEGVEVFRDYEVAIARSGADLAYVSLANSNHARWVERALHQGMHVIVDKPAFVRLDDAHRLVRVAQQKRLCLAEATVFTFHPQINAAIQAVDEVRTKITRVSAVFSFPPLDRADFRFRHDLGGGALWDIGPYVVAASRMFFRDKPKRIAGEVVTRSAEDGLDLAFSVLMTYPGDGALTGHFGFDTEYQNRLHLLGPGITIDINRSFTLPPDQPGRLVLRRKNIESEVIVPAADAFALFLKKVIEGIGHGQWNEFVDALLADAELLSQLRNACGEQ
jgi:predicted dehydrogenase